MFKPWQKTFVYLFLAIILLIFLHWLGWLTSLERISAKVLAPIQHTAYRLKNFSGHPLKYLQDQTNLITQQAKLQQENANLKQALAQAKNYQEENESLKQQLGYLGRQSLHYVTTKVLNRSLDSETILILDRGQNSQITVGSPVIIQEGILIGKIIKTEPEHAYLRLLTDNLSKVAVSIQNSKQTTGLALGQYGLNLIVEKIPQEQKVQNGDLIITSGLEERLPRGLLVGEINEVIQKPGDIFQSASVKPLANLTNLTFVTVILP